MTILEDPATTLNDDQDVFGYERPFHTHPFLTEAGKRGHGHRGGDQPHNHRHDLKPYEGERYTDMDKYLEFVRRVIKGAGNRVGESDVTWLAELVSLRAELDDAIMTAVSGLRHDEAAPASWTEIGEALGITRQSAQARYGAVGGARGAGGQKAEWR